MKRYKLKKDLPTFKAGEIFEISPFGNLVRVDDGDSPAIIAYASSTIKKFPNILEDWFEEMEEPAIELSGQCTASLGMDIFTLGHDYDSTNVVPKPLFNRNHKERLAKVGLSFRTEKECQEWIDYQEAYQILRQDTKGFTPDWKDSGQNKTLVYYDSCDKKLKVVPWSINAFGGIYFATSADADESIKKHEKEWMIYLGVDE